MSPMFNKTNLSIEFPGLHQVKPPRKKRQSIAFLFFVASESFFEQMNNLTWSSSICMRFSID